MGLQLKVEQMPGYLAARFIGVGVAEDVWRQFNFIAEHCNRTKNNKLLIDTAEAEFKVSLAERFLAVEEARVFARYRLKVAVVTKPERLDPQRFGETVARNRGVNISAFTNVEDAEKWLLKRPPEAAA